MASLYRRFIARIANATDTERRIAYGVIALTSLVAILYVSVPMMLNLMFNSDDCLWGVKKENGNPVMFVASVVEGGAAEKAGVQVGDIVLAINGKPVKSDILGAQRILNESPVETPISYMVMRNGRVLDLPIILVQRIQIIQVLVPIFSLLWLLIGITVALTQPKGSIQRLFFLMSASVVFSFTFPGFSRNAIIRILWTCLVGMFYPLWVLFCSNFPVKQKVFEKGSRVFALFSPFIVIVLLRFVLSAFVVVSDGFNEKLGIIIIIIYAGYFGSGQWFLGRGSKMLPAGTARRPMNIILLGTALAALALMYLSVLQFTSSGLTMFMQPQTFLPVFLILAMPISFGYVLFRYQLMDFSMVVRTTIVYALTTTVIVASYVLLGYVVSRVLGSLIASEGIKKIVEIGSFVVLLLVLDPLRRWLQRTVANRFFPRQRDYTEQLARFSNELTETVGMQAVSGLTASTLHKALNLDSVCVMVEDAKHGMLQKVARVSEKELVEVEEETLVLLQKSLRRSRNVIALETLGDPAFDELIPTYPYAAGLYAQGSVVGAVLMSNPRDGDKISGSQMPFISGVLGQAATAIEVARLYEEELERRQYREELMTARRIQQSLLPTVMPEFSGITISAVALPAEAVGGDYYNVLPVDEHRFVVIVADVSGKGLPAALYMAELHGMMRIAVMVSNSPKQILATLNDNLCRTMERGTFITATVLLFDTLHKTVSYARAGHTPIIRRNGAAIDPLIPQGFPLGMPAQDHVFENALQEYTVRYEPGETFILYSDGVSEAMNARREEFGDGRLLDVIGATKDRGADVLCREIIRRVEDFRGSAEQHDDITLVVVRVEKDAAEKTEEERSLSVEF